MDRPKISASDPPAPLRLLSGIPGATSISAQRRLFDARLATRWRAGVGPDIGGAPDSLALYAGLFPLIVKVITYDRPQSDARLLDNIDGNGFEFVLSSHRLDQKPMPTAEAAIEVVLQKY